MRSSRLVDAVLSLALAAPACVGHGFFIGRGGGDPDRPRPQARRHGRRDIGVALEQRGGQPAQLSARGGAASVRAIGRTRRRSRGWTHGASGWRTTAMQRAPSRSRRRSRALGFSGTRRTLALRPVRFPACASRDVRLEDAPFRLVAIANRTDLSVTRPRRRWVKARLRADGGAGRLADVVAAPGHGHRRVRPTRGGDRVGEPVACTRRCFGRCISEQPERSGGIARDGRPRAAEQEDLATGPLVLHGSTSRQARSSRAPSEYAECGLASPSPTSPRSRRATPTRSPFGTYVLPATWLSFVSAPTDVAPVPLRRCRSTTPSYGDMRRMSRADGPRLSDRSARGGHLSSLAFSSIDEAARRDRAGNAVDAGGARGGLVIGRGHTNSAPATLCIRQPPCGDFRTR